MAVIFIDCAIAQPWKWNWEDKGIKITIFNYDKLSLKYVDISYPL